MQYKKNSNRNKYSLTTYNKSWQDEPFQFDSFSKEKFYDNELINTEKSFFSCMKTVGSQQIELEEFDNETDCGVNEIEAYYNNEEYKIHKKFIQEKEILLNNYSNSIGRYSFYKYLNRDTKIKEMEEKLNSGCNEFLNAIKKRKKNVIQTYRAQRELQYNKLLEQQQNYWSKGYLLDCE